MTTASANTAKIATATRTKIVQAQSPSGPDTLGSRLSDAQLVILSTAAARVDGAVLPTPEHLKAKGGALTRVLQALIRRELIEEVQARPDRPVWRTDEEGSRFALRITAAGLRAIGAEFAEQQEDSGSEVAHAGQGDKAPAAAGSAAARSSSKADALLALLRREQGTSLPELMQASGWQAHSVRGFLSATVKTRMGLTLTSSKGEDGTRRYRVVA